MVTSLIEYRWYCALKRACSMSNKLAKRKIAHCLKIVFFYGLFIFPSFGSHYEKILNIQNQNKIKDLSFEVKIENLKKSLKPYFPLQSLKEFKIEIFWLEGGQFDINLKNLQVEKKV